MKNNKLVFIIGSVLLYLVSTGISYAIFTSVGGKTASKPITTPTGKSIVDPSLPKTEVCPLNGAKFTEMERKIWETRRPLAIMIENHEEARPQSGLSYADIIYEAIAEGGITRFMAVNYCGIAAYNIGLAPVRSARTYYVDWVSEYDALYNHVGGAGNCNDDTVDPRAKALCQIQKYDIKDMDQFNIPFPTCTRNYDRLDHEVATEHTMVCYSDKLYELAVKRNWTNVDADGVSWDADFKPWKFKDEPKENEKGTTASIAFVFSGNFTDQYAVQWKYDAVSNTYKRFNGSQEHTDLETKQQLAAKNVVIQFAKETVGVDEHGHMLYGTNGTGKAMIFQDGKAITGTWKKATRTDRTVFYDDKGKEVEFVRGQIWIEVVALDTQIKY